VDIVLLCHRQTMHQLGIVELAMSGIHSFSTDQKSPATMCTSTIDSIPIKRRAKQTIMLSFDH
jgi:hypothetical protein